MNNWIVTYLNPAGIRFHRQVRSEGATLASARVCAMADLLQHIPWTEAVHYRFVMAVRDYS